VLVARGRRILAELDAANAELLALKGMESGRVRVGTMHTMGPIDVSLVLAIFHERHRGIELTVREESSEELAAMVRHDELDLAFLSVTEQVESHDLGLHQLVLEELVVLLAPGHPLARRRRLGIADLKQEEFISFREGARLRELLFAAARDAGFQPNVKLESNESQRIRRLVSRGMGVAILPRSDALAPGAEVAVIDLTDPPLARDITLAWREGRRHPPAVAEFLELAREVFSASLDEPRSLQ
jgi:DNA-binding transcriptional LysR family regulator